MLSRLLHGLFRAAPGRAGQPARRPGFRPRLESLEDRRVLSTLQPAERALPRVEVTAAPVASQLAQVASAPNQATPVAQSQPQGAGKLIIAGKRLFETDATYLKTIWQLTIPGERIPAARELVKAKNVNALRQLEDPLRRQIFDAMNNNSRNYSFPTLAAAQQNFRVRIEVIDFMRRIQEGDKFRDANPGQPVPPGMVDFDYYAFPSAANPQGVKSEAHAGTWMKQAWSNPVYPVTDYSFVFRSRPGVKAHDAIVGITTHRFRGECLGAIELAILRAADIAIGWQRFNALHKNGLQGIGALGNSSLLSIMKHITVDPRTGTLENFVTDGRQVRYRFHERDMVPGDWVYFRNDPTYLEKLLPGREGYWNGENAVYMGNYSVNWAGAPVYSRTLGGAPARFSGMGLYDYTEAQLKNRAAEKFFQDTGKQANKNWMGFTMLSRVKTGV